MYVGVCVCVCVTDHFLTTIAAVSASMTCSASRVSPTNISLTWMPPGGCVFMQHRIEKGRRTECATTSLFSSSESQSRGPEQMAYFESLPDVLQI